MKSNIAIISTICILFLASCQTKNVTIRNESPNHQVKIAITAMQKGVMSPWKVDMAVKAYDFKEGHLAFELQTSEVNNQTVKFEWKDDKNCLITCELSDGTARKFQLIADAGQVQLAEVNL